MYGQKLAKKMYNRTRIIWHPTPDANPVELTTGIWNQGRLPVVNEYIKFSFVTNTGMVDVDGFVYKVSWTQDDERWVEPVLEVLSYEVMVARL